MRIKITAVIIFLFIIAFKTEEVYELKYPDYFPKPVYDFKKNPLSRETIELGRALFYDPVLSKDSTISCASCHSNYNSFSHTDHQLSHGIKDQIGTRNSLALINLAWHKLYMWDGAVNHLNMQALAPINHPKEMGEKTENVIAKLQHNKRYPELFYRAYNDSIITGERMLKAISQFLLTLISCNSKYDRIKQNKEHFTQQEENGYNLFRKNCNACHREPLFSNYGFENNGLPIDNTLNDYGRWMVTKQAADSLKFKIPTLRNLSYTYPYMHDGRFNKLNQVINHYLSGIKQSPTLAKELKKPIVLTSNEKVDLIAFLLTLNDSSFVFNDKFKFPKNILK